MPPYDTKRGRPPILHPGRPRCNAQNGDFVADRFTRFRDRPEMTEESMPGATRISPGRHEADDGIYDGIRHSSTASREGRRSPGGMMASV